MDGKGVESVGGEGARVESMRVYGVSEQVEVQAKECHAA